MSRVRTKRSVVSIAFPALFCPADKKCPQTNAGGRLKIIIETYRWKADVVPQTDIYRALPLEVNYKISLPSAN